MTEAASYVLGPWSNFYILAGSSAGALTGLMFVVITLVTDVERLRRSPDGISAFGTPTVAHFSAALLVSAILSAPWHSLLPPAIILGLAGLYGVVYICVAARRATRLTTYTPDLDDFVWYTIIPLVAYGSILAGAITLPYIPVKALFALAGGSLLLIFIGIRNAWDIVTFIAIEHPDKPSEKPSDKSS
jgi:hypothetical protein